MKNIYLTLGLLILFSGRNIYAERANIIAALDNVSTPANWSDIINNDEYLSSDISGMMTSPPNADDVMLCVSGIHANDDSLSCAYLNPNGNNSSPTSNPYSVKISNSRLGIGISAALSYSLNHYISTQGIKIAPLDSLCYAYSNQGWNQTNWWEYYTASWEGAHYFHATISIVENSSGKYYAGLSNCSLSSS